MKEDLYIIGAGSVGGHLAANLKEYSGSQVLKGFIDDDPAKVGTEFMGYPVLGSVAYLLKLKNVYVAIGIAFPKVKKLIIEKLKENNTLTFPTFVHSRAWVSKDVNIGNGVIIYPNTSINYGSTIDDYCVFNMNCALGHHTKVGKFTSFAPGVNTGGHTSLGVGVEMGIGCSTIQGVTIGDGSIIGGQAMVTQNVPSNSIAKGIPAKW